MPNRFIIGVLNVKLFIFNSSAILKQTAMKRFPCLLIGVFLLTSSGVFLTIESHAQIDLKKKVGDLKKKVENIGKGKEKTEDPVEEEGSEKKASADTVKPDATQEAKANTAVQPEKAYAKFDFIPGEQVLFEDDFRNESADEIPSFWVVSEGKVEVARINGEYVMGFLESSPTAYPRQKAGNEYPDRITLEFDYLWRFNSKTWEQAWRDGNTAGGDLMRIRFAIDKEYYDMDSNEKAKVGDFYNDLKIYSDGTVRFDNFEGKYSSGDQVPSLHPVLFQDLNGKWVHVSIGINESSLKVYLNQERVLNAPIQSGKLRTFQFTAESATADALGSQAFVRNVRIAKGGANPYKKLTAEGRIIARGINFDVGKATLKPESMGALNNIVKMMQEHPELKFEVGGHTDSDGDDALNMKLSQDRANAVRNKLVSMGIDGGRLTAKGYGETKPLSPNTTPEQKANNRRVEFVKQ